jgi:hypothetical protein
MRTTRIIALFTALFVLFAACGGGDETSRTGAQASPTAGPAGENGDAAGETGDAPSGDAGDGGTSSGDTGSSADTASATPPPQGEPPLAAPEGTVNRPRPGTYLYDLEGSERSPFCPNPDGCPYGPDAQVDHDLDVDDQVYTVVVTTSEGGGRMTTRTRWEDARVLLLSTRTVTPVGTFGCEFNPPVEIARFPVKTEAFGPQQWSGENCEGTTTIEVIGQEDATDANGKVWTTWKVHQRTEYRFGDVSGVLEGDVWTSPDLGYSIRSDTRNEGTFQSQPISSHQITLLKRHP